MADLQITSQFYRSDIRGNQPQPQNSNNVNNKNKPHDRENKGEYKDYKDFNENQENPTKLNDENENQEEGYYDSKEQNRIRPQREEEVVFDEILILFLNVTSLKQVIIYNINYINI